MSTSLRIAVVCPSPWPPADDPSWRAAQEAAALVRRGHRVTILVPGTRPDDLADGRRRLEALAAGDRRVLDDDGRPRVVVVGRAIRTGARRRVAGPLDLAAGLETALAHGGFDVVHVHEPLSPSPALASLRHTEAATVATFHRADPLAGVAFLGPLVHRALARVDVRIAVSRSVQRALTEILPGRYEVLPSGVDPSGEAGTHREGLLLVARGRDRAGLRFVLRLARDMDPALTGPIRILGPNEAVWRTRAAVPKALRPTAAVLADDGPAAWRQALDRSGIVVLAAPGDVAGPITAEALARGCVVVAPRGTAADETLRHGENAVVLPPFQRSPWVDALRELLMDPGRRDELGMAAARSHAHPTWDEVAVRLEAVYREAMSSPHRRDQLERVTVDLRLRPSPLEDPARLGRACREAGLDVVAVAGPDGVAAARRLAAHAPPDLTVITGREIATAEGTVVGLFLAEDVPDGLQLHETLTRIRAQGGITLLPHPDTCTLPPAAALREMGGLIDCRELATGASGPAGLGAVRDAQRQGLVVSAGSAATTPQAVGGAGMTMRAFEGADDFLAALAEAEPIVPRRGRRARARGRGRGPNT